MSAQPSAPRGETPVRTRINLWTAFLVVLLVACWHFAVWLCSDGMRIGDVILTLRALVRLHPAELEGDVTTASLGVVVAVWLVLFVVVCGLIFAAVAWVRGRRGRRKDGLAGQGELRRRVGSGKKGASSTQLLSPIARYGKTYFRPRVEDTASVIAPPRQGKTAYLALGQIVDAPGAVVATSTKVDVLRLTAEQRSNKGRVWVFDPEGISAWPEQAHWDIVAGCEDIATARKRAAALVAGRPLSNGGQGNVQFFTQAASAVLRCLLHAAALGGLTMRDVLRWARDFSDDEPYAILRDHPDAEAGTYRDLRTFCRGEAQETVSSTDMSLRLVLDPLGDERVVETVCPPARGVASEGRQSFDAARFVESHDTLYLLSEGEQAGAGSLTTALVDSVKQAARAKSQRTAAGRIDPPLMFILDEFANIASIPDAPTDAADGGGRGLSFWFIYQAYSQLQSRYGNEGARTIWQASLVRLVMGGSVEDDFLESVSRLLGDKKVDQVSRRYGSDLDDAPDWNVGTEHKRVLSVSDVREIAEGRALLLYRDQKGAVVDLVPWWKRKDARAFSNSQKWCLQREGITA